MVLGRRFHVVVLSLALVSIIGCGGSSNCLAGLNVAPATATVNHSAAGNSEAFRSSFQFKNSPGCVGLNSAALASSTWAANDPSVRLSVSPSTQVTATCTAAVANPVTVTATSADGRMLTGTALLTCN